MGQVVWMSGLVVSAGVAWAVSSSEADQSSEFANDATVAYVEPEIGETEVFTVSSGSALSAAAFGMAALQPETYNGEIVMDIINASHLADDEKSRLAGDLAAVAAGRAELTAVLFDVRIALALE